MGISAFACGKVDMLIQFFPAVLAFEPEHRLQQHDGLAPYRNAAELSHRLTVVHHVAASAVCATEFVLSRFDFKLNHVIFVSCPGALLVSQTECLEHKAGMHDILDWWFFQR